MNTTRISVAGTLWLAVCLSSIAASRGTVAQEGHSPMVTLDDATYADWIARWDGNITGDARNRYCDKAMGEDIGWLMTPFTDGFYYGYLATLDPKWVEMSVDWTDSWVKRAVTEPDGCPGWPRPEAAGTKVDDLDDFNADSMLGEAMVLRPVVRMAGEILKTPALRERFGVKAESYLTLAERIYEKWDQRGGWRETENGAMISVVLPYGIDGSTGNWTEGFADRNAPGNGFSHPNNKANHVARWLLAMSDVTGKAVYKERAEQWFTLMKSRMTRNEDGTYDIWDYWEPAGPWDKMPGGAPKHWVGVHPNPGYYQIDVAAIVDAYEHGVVFSREDIEHLVATALAENRHWDALVPYSAAIQREFEATMKPDSWSGLSAAATYLMLQSRLRQGARVDAEPHREARYVVDQASPIADDDNPGIAAQPWKTIQKAADMAQPGDVIHVMAGRYDERVTCGTDGTSGNPIAFVAVPQRSVIVSGFELDASFIRVEGFEITADKPATAFQLRSSHCEIVGNYVHHMITAVNGTYGEASPDGATRDYSAVTHNRIAYNEVYHCEYGFILGGDDWLVENNEIHRLFLYASGNTYDDCDYTRFFGTGCIQRYNYYHGSRTAETRTAHVDAIQTFMNNGGMAQDLLFEFNTCFDFGQGAMIESAPHIGSVRNWTWRHNIYSSDLSTYKGAWGLNVIQTPDVTIENNTFAGITWYGVGLRGQESTGGQIRNNLFCEIHRAVTDDLDFSPADPLVEYNLTFETAPLADPTNIHGTDPLFVDRPQRNFRLQHGSPAVGAGKDGATIGALAYPNVYYVDPRHPAAADEPAWGYPGVPLASLTKACSLARPGETIILRGGVYRELLAPNRDGVTVRTIHGEKVAISGADLIEGWRREPDSRWSAPLPAEPKRILRDGQPWTEFEYDRAEKRIITNSGGDPRLHVHESIVRELGIELDGKQNVQVEGITVVNTLSELRQAASSSPMSRAEGQPGMARR